MSTIVITDYILNYIKEIVRAQYIYIYIYIKSKLGITHFAHKYMKTSHVASKPKLLKTLAWSGIWTHDLQITCLTLSHLSYQGYQAQAQVYISLSIYIPRYKCNNVAEEEHYT